MAYVLDGIAFNVNQYGYFNQIYPLMAGGLPFNPAGYTARLNVRQNPGDATPLLAITTTASSVGQIVLAVGSIQFIFYAGQCTPAVVTLGPPPTFDVQLDPPGGPTQSISLIRGPFIVEPGNTH